MPEMLVFDGVGTCFDDQPRLQRTTLRFRPDQRLLPAGERPVNPSPPTRG
jgi:hypothetical protein